MKYNIFLEIKYRVHIFNLLCMAMYTPTNAQKLLMFETETNDSTSPICSSIAFDKRPKAHTIVLDTLQDNWSLNNCLNNLTEDHDRIIFTGDYVLDQTTKNKLNYFLYKAPNIIVYTKNFSNTIFSNPVAEAILQSHWSLLYVVVVDNGTFSCENGYFGQEINASIHSFLNKFWQKYQIADVVMEYPIACPNRFSLYDGNKKPSPNYGQLYERNVTTVFGRDVQKTLRRNKKNLADGYPLKANIFYRFPTSITECDFLSAFMVFNSDLTNGYCGVDALVLQDVMQAFKFNTTFEVRESTSIYGYVKSGHATGTLGLIVRGEIDISFNSRFMVLYLENGFEFLYFTWRDSLCALMKEPSAVSLWHYPFNIYNATMWTFTLFCLMCVGLVTYVKSRIMRNFGIIPLKLHVYVVNALWSGLFGFFFNRRIRRSLLAATCLLCSVVLTAKYQGHVNYMFATLVRYNRFSTLEEMWDNDVQVYTAPSITSLLGYGYTDGNTNNAKTKLLQHLKFYPTNASTIDYALRHSHVATIQRTDVLLETLINYRDKDGRPLLYIVNECFQDYYLSYIVRSGFIFTEELQILIMQIVEAGLPSVYYKWTRYTFKVIDSITKPVSEPRPIIKISMQEQRIPFILLLLGYALSTVVFVIELWWDTRAKRKRNNITLQKYLD